MGWAGLFIFLFVVLCVILYKKRVPIKKAFDRYRGAQPVPQEPPQPMGTLHPPPPSYPMSTNPGYQAIPQPVGGQPYYPNPSQNTAVPVYPPQTAGAPVYPQQTAGAPVYPPQSGGAPVYPPPNAGAPIYPQQNTGA